MAIDPSKEPERSSFDPQAAWRERQKSLRITERIREAQERFGVTPHVDAAVDRPGNSHTAAMLKQAAERSKPSRPQRLPHDPLPRRQGARVVSSSRDTDARSRCRWRPSRTSTRASGTTTAGTPRRRGEAVGGRLRPGRPVGRHRREAAARSPDVRSSTRRRLPCRVAGSTEPHLRGHEPSVKDDDYGPSL